jgi:phage baseplate assembly protein W
MALAKVVQFGSDLRLLDSLDRQSSRKRGSDLSVRTRNRSERLDLETVSAVDNIRQALLLRLLTPTGELAPLGHPDYGCRLGELVGQLNNERTRNLAKMFVLQALSGEPRIAQVLAVKVTPGRADRTRIDITVDALTREGPSPLNLVFPFFLERTGAA